jgi:Tol biopolymer transport system component
MPQSKEVIRQIKKTIRKKFSADGLELFFSGQAWQPNPTGFGGSDLWVTRRATKNHPWGEPENLGPTVNTGRIECEPSISADGLSLYFGSDRSGWSIWVTTRKTKDEPWEEPVNLGPTVNSGGA